MTKLFARRQASAAMIRMFDVLAIVLFIGSIVGVIVLAAQLCLLPQRLFLQSERWLTEQEFRTTFPGKAWCRHVPGISVCFGFAAHVTMFLTMMATANNMLPMMIGFIPL